MTQTAAEITRPKVVLSPCDTGVLHAIAEHWPSGCEIELEAGNYVISRPISLPSHVTIRGQGEGRTVFVLAPGSHCHMFTNSDHLAGNEDITLADFSLIGNGDAQERQSHHKSLTFCCGMYFKSCRSVRVSKVDFFDIRQTCVHFNGSEGLVVEACRMARLGWSGVSSSDASNLKILDVEITDAGRDEMHSAIHLDAGVGITCHADVSNTTGNGIMLDSAYGPLRQVFVKGTATGCKRGVSLSGSAVNELADVLVTGRFSDNREVGVMVSNARSVVLHDCTIARNPGSGVLLQGRNGGCDVMLAACRFEGNGEDVSEIHASKGNWLFTDGNTIDREIRPNRRTCADHRGRARAT